MCPLPLPVLADDIEGCDCTRIEVENIGPSERGGRTRPPHVVRPLLSLAQRPVARVDGNAQSRWRCSGSSRRAKRAEG
jgi:hypothetical protein